MVPVTWEDGSVWLREEEEKKKKRDRDDVMESDPSWAPLKKYSCIADIHPSLSVRSFFTTDQLKLW